MINDLNVREGASKVIEILLRNEFRKDQESGYYGKCSFEDYIDNEYASYYLDGEGDDKFDTEGLWKHVKNLEPYGENQPVTAEHEGLTGSRVAHYGGEGKGDDYWAVLSLSDGLTTRYFRRDGYYSSYNGSSLDGETYEVRPTEKTVVVYE